ncbi:MAG: fibronectin type III domain-containing protein [Terracidiphilus sp.]
MLIGLIRADNLACVHEQRARYMGANLQRVCRLWLSVLMFLPAIVGIGVSGAEAQQVEPSLPISQRFTINLAAGVPEYVADATSTSNEPQSHWWFQNTNNSATYSSPGFVESSDTAATWKQVGLPYDANIPRTFINQVSGGGEDTGNFNWYRLHFKVDPKYAGQKFLLDLEGAHTGVQVFINGNLLPGISAVAANSQATHVIGFVPVQVDLTPYIVADGSSDNVIAIDVSRNAGWYTTPGFCEVFRFGQDMAGLFRNVYMYVTNPVHIPLNVYSNTKTWGTYVGTVSEVPAAEGTATAASAVVNVQTNVLNESTTAQQVTLTTQIVDQQGNVVVTAPPMTLSLPAMTPDTFPSGPVPQFNQLITVPNPTLWYPNNSIYGKPYMYKVYSIVSVNGAVVDSFESPLGIRTLTWDANFPYFNGQLTHLWGGASRYDYPALGSSVPDEVWWRDLAEFAASGGNVWRPGHCSQSEEFVEAADAYGVMVDQPSGDGEGHWNATSNPSADDLQLKQEVHRDMIIRDRSHPSILDWEADNGGNNTPLADALMALSTTWDNIAPRVQADRGYNPAWGFMAECDGAGCEVAMKGSYPNNPAFGAEYWDNMGTGRGTVINLGGVSVSAYDYELAYSAPYIDDWRQGRAANTFGMAQWYFADTPGEISTWAEFQNQPLMINQANDANGSGNPLVRSLGYSMVDQNRFPRLLYYVYQANWVPYAIQPVVHLAHHWNRAYEYTAGTPIQVNGFSNCPKVRLLINGAAKDPVTGEPLADQTPNPWNIDSHSDLSQSTTIMPGQVHWMVNWAPGTATAECIGEDGNPVSGVSHTLTTAGAESKIVLTVLPEVVRPDGTSFQWTANGSDAAFVQAEVEDAQGNWVPTAMDDVTFTVTGTGGTYMGGTQQLVAVPQWTNDYQDAFSQLHENDIANLPYGFFHAPGDLELNFEGGLQKIALRSTFTPAPVTVTASALGLGTSNTVTLTSVAPPPPPQTEPPVIIVPPVDEATTVGYPATFTISASGGGTLSYQWYQDGSQISGATSSTYTTPDTTLAENNETFTVTVSSNYGLVNSNPVTLTVAAAANVAITTQPGSQTVVVGQSATLTVAATGSPALNYAWYENGSLVQSGSLASFTTPILTATGTEIFNVIVSNPVGQLQSNNAVLTIAAPTPVSIVTEPVTAVAVANNQPVQISAVVAGSAPYTYQWNFTPTNGAATILGASTQLLPTISYEIPQFSSANVGAYTVTVNNAAAAPVTSTATNLTLAPPGVNLALDMTATASSSQNACTNAATTPPFSGTNCLGAENAVDGIISENSRWGSALANAPPTPSVPGIDPSWLQVDLGSSVAFNTVVIYWENAYATQYAIQYTNGDPTVASNWQTAFSNPNGIGGIDQESFPTVTARYIRVLGEQRATQYGYSIIEFQVYDVAQCGGSTERYTVISSSNPSQVTDNITGLTWTRTTVTDSTPGSQFTGVSAASYCSSINMRLPTASEALTISSNSDAVCAFPGVWSTWTSTVDPNDATRTAIVNYDGTQSYQVTVNYPGETLCDLSPGSPVAPAIQTQPQSTTSSVGQTATFSVIASGTPAPTYQWYGNGTAISGATNASYTTPTLAATDNGDTFYVVVTNSVNSVTSTKATLTVTASTQCTTSPAAPTGLTATASSSSAIGLSWTADAAPANCSITSYNVYGSTTNGFTPSAGTLVGKVATGTSYSNTGLTAATTYYYVVEAVDADGSSSPSSQTSATTSASGSAPDFTLGASPATLSVTAGSSGTETVTVTPENGFSSTSTVGFTCSGLPTGATCSFAPATVNAAGNIVSTLTVNTTTASAAIRNRSSLWFPGSVLAVALCYLGRKKRRTFQLMLLAVAMSGLALLTACGGTSSNSTAPMNPLPVTSTVTITATAGSLQHTTTFSLAVQSTTAYAAPTTPHSKSDPWFPGSALAGVFCFLGRKRRRGVQLLLAASLASISALSGCGGSSPGTPVSPQPTAPSITMQPVSQSVGVGQMATFSVVASGTAPLTYQWQSNGTTISGATAASYTTPAASAAISGTNYQVVVSNSAGSATSNAAVLTVTNSSCSAAPATPTGLTATASSSSVIGLGWTAVTPPANCTISSYSVYRSTTSGFTPFSGNLIESGLTSPAYSDTGLSPSTTYYYAVEAIDAVSSSAPSSQASAETMAAGASCIAVPSAPASVTATASSSSIIGLSWAAVTPPANCAIGSYSVYGSTISGFTPSSSNLIASGVTGTNYSNTGLAASSTYYYAVEAVDGDGSSAPSAQASATTQASGSTEIVAIASGGPAQSNANGGDFPFVADEYGVGGGENGAVTSAINLNQPGANAAPMGVYQNGRVGVSTYTIPGLAAGAQYTVLLHFAETYFTTVGSREFNVAINGVPVIPNLDVYGTVGADAALVKQFTATANTSGQIVIAFTNGLSNAPLVMGIEVRGVPSRCTVVPAAPPTGLTAAASSPSIIGLSWATVVPPPNCAITYNLYGSTTVGFTPSSATLIATGLTSPAYSNIGLAASTIYYYAVEAVDTAGASVPSAQASAETNSANSCVAIPPSPPGELTATASSSSAIDLSWAAITPQANCSNITYNLFGSTTGGFAPSANNEIAVGLTGTAFVNNALPPSTTYYYAVQAADEDGASVGVSSQVSATTLTPETTLTAFTVSANEIDLNWPASTAAAPVTYTIFRSTAPAFTPTGSNSIGTTKSNWFQDVLATAATTYYYMVEGSGPSGTSAPAGPVNATTLSLGSNPPFWDASNMPAASTGDVMEFKILNRTNGQYTDDQITWSATINGVTTTNTIAGQPTFSMPANASGRMYFYLGNVGQGNTDYYDFIEYTIGTTGTAGVYFFNGDTTRVDAFGVKLAMQLTCGDGTNIAVGENAAAFAENRAATFQHFIDAVPADFQTEATLTAPYRIVEPGAGGFNTGGPYQDYYNPWIDQLWTANDFNTTDVPLAGPNGSGVAEPSLSGAVYRHVGAVAGTFDPTTGNLLNNALWGNPSAFYQTDPTDHYSKFIHSIAINGQQYAFPYDDSGGYSSDVSCNSPNTLLVAVGW